MKKLILGCASAIALFGLAACSDTDETTTQAVPEQAQPMEQPQESGVAPIAPVEPTTPPVTTPATPPAE